MPAALSFATVTSDIFAFGAEYVNAVKFIKQSFEDSKDFLPLNYWSGDFDNFQYLIVYISDYVRAMTLKVPDFS